MSESEPKATATKTSQNLAKAMCAQSSCVVSKVISFTNNEVPEYLENLRKFEEESRKAQIVVK